MTSSDSCLSASCLDAGFAVCLKFLMSSGAKAPSRETARPNETAHAVEMRSQWKHYLNRIAIFLLLSSMVAAGWPGDEVKRPRILGISHMALFVSDLGEVALVL
jgi:hypothetical protein